MDHDKMMVDLSNALNAAAAANTRLFKENAELRAQNENLRHENAGSVHQWSADLKAAIEKLGATRVANEGFARENRELKTQIESIESKNDELDGLLTNVNREYVELFHDRNNLRAQIESIKSSDTAKVIDTLLADKTILQAAIQSIGSIVKVAEQL